MPPENLLTPKETEALLSLFASRDAAPASSGNRTGEAPGKRSETVGKARKLFARTAERWKEGAEAATGLETACRLRSIVRPNGPVRDGFYWFEALRSKERKMYVGVPEALVNLVNERALGAVEELPPPAHRLTRTDRVLFETTGRFFSGSPTADAALRAVEAPGKAGRPLEAVFELQIRPLLRTEVLLRIDEAQL